MKFAFNSLHDFIAMGQHGIYVWSAWFVALLSIVYLVMQSRHARQRFFKDEQINLQLQKARAARLKQESLK